MKYLSMDYGQDSLSALCMPLPIQTFNVITINDHIIT